MLLHDILPLRLSRYFTNMISLNPIMATCCRYYHYPDFTDEPQKDQIFGQGLIAKLAEPTDCSVCNPN